MGSMVRQSTIIIGCGLSAMRVDVHSSYGRSFCIAVYFPVEVQVWVVSGMFRVVVGKWEGSLLAS